MAPDELMNKADDLKARLAATQARMMARIEGLHRRPSSLFGAMDYEIMQNELVAVENAIEKSRPSSDNRFDTARRRFVDREK